MKRTNAILCGVLILLWSVTAIGAPPMQKQLGLSKAVSTADIDYQTYIDANRLLMFVTNQGSFAYDNGSLFGKADGLYYPRGTNLSVIYAGGLWLGAKVGGDLRVSLAEYSHTYWPGPVVGGTFIEDADSDPQYRVYKIIKDRLNSGFYDEDRPVGDPVLQRIWDDWHEWPSDMGAPLDSVDTNTVPDGEWDVIRPKLSGDQTLWAVYNDIAPDGRTNSAGTTDGLGVEIQQTVFAFNRTGSLGECAFIKFKIINKSASTLEGMYASVWADPDLGDAGDDLVGSDTTLSMGYVYNATNNDANYGKTPPAAGYDFFQGPMVPSPGDVAIFNDGRVVEDHKILGMTSFNKYINATDPDNAVEAYWYMQGLDAKNSGLPLTDPNGIVTTFMMPGDPTTGTGWLDDNESDRRFMCSTGPFEMAPDDTQEVVVAVVVAQGSDRLTSVTALKFNDLFAQSAFDKNFVLPDPPARPVVKAVPAENAIVLEWGTESEDNPGDYAFQGYNVYQGASVAGPWTRVATFDIDDKVGIIFDLEFVVSEGAVIDHPVQFGSDSGVRRYIKLAQDYVNGGNLNNVFDYYWAVTAYSYDPGEVPKTLENAPEAITVSPQKPAGGFVYEFDYGDMLEVTHEEGLSDADVVSMVVDPTVTNGHEYAVSFVYDEEDVAVWNLYDETAQTLILENQPVDDNYAVAVVDGIQTRALPPPFGFKTIVESKGAGGVINDPAPIVLYPNESTQGYYVSSDEVDEVALTTNTERFNWQGLIGTDWWEFRFTAGGSQYYDYLTDSLRDDRAPFEIWNLGPGWPDDPTDDRRVQFMCIDDDESGDWTLHDRIYVVETPYAEPLPTWAVYDWPGSFHLGRVRIEGVVPATGTVIQFQTLQGHAPGDIFSFHTVDVIEEDLAADTEYSMENIKVVPNPYFNQSLYEPDQFDRRIKFTNLPFECEIKIFTLAGDHVVTLEKEPSDASYLTWNMLTKNNLPLASGVYLYIVTADDVGEFVGKMAIFTEVEQLNTY